MASVPYTKQLHETISIPRKEFSRKILYNKELSKKDLRVFLALLTLLDGIREVDVDTRRDRENFEKVNKKRIAESLDMSEKDVENSFQKLEEEGIIQEGSTIAIRHGYRFLF